MPETLMTALQEIGEVYAEARKDPEYDSKQLKLASQRICRPSDGACILPRRSNRVSSVALKFISRREDLLHTGAHKINNVIGQALLALRMGKKRIIAETGAGQHGIATAAACAKFGLECVIYMGRVDMERQASQRLPHALVWRGGSFL